MALPAGVENLRVSTDSRINSSPKPAWLAGDCNPELEAVLNDAQSVLCLIPPPLGTLRRGRWERV